jgi:hypothetical protein
VRFPVLRGLAKLNLLESLSDCATKDGIPIGTANDNPVLDSRIYEVEFPDGYKTSMAANVTAENLFAQVDPEGNRLAVFEDIID